MTAPTTTRSRHPWSLSVLTLLCVTVAAVAVTPYLTASLDTLAADDVGLAAGYAARPAVVRGVLLTHVVAGGVALLLSPVQLWPGLRRRVPAVHRWAGRVTVAAILVAGTAGIVLAPFNHAGPIGTAGFGLLGAAWVWTAWQGFRAIRAGDVAAHRRWMTRTFALTFAAVTLRLWTGLLVGGQVMLLDVDPAAAFDRAYALVPFGCWVPNLVVAELWLRRRGLSRAAAPRAA
ncbi:putative membrane protein [Isoptericola jiangsuensis]|uniref:Putative membrane protein n=1 Tax=Isoptericola jiangsuensis TaxID=548579 RepID=A0A2A9ET62_9MICO|nr:DUF2306 domain-containing protein [Isoptericola jiangsuensis]PFG41460.1 putative membrane protein [Isoptericola jiangsuensis]